MDKPTIDAVNRLVGERFTRNGVTFLISRVTAFGIPSTPTHYHDTNGHAVALNADEIMYDVGAQCSIYVLKIEE